MIVGHPPKALACEACVPAPSRHARRAAWIVAWTLVSWAGLASAVLRATFAADETVPNSPPKVHKVFVPAGTPSQWPPGDWRPLPLEELERRLRRAQRGDPRDEVVSLEQAEYRAALIGNELQRGRFSWIPRRGLDGPEFLTLDPLNVSLAHLNQRQAGIETLTPVTWGTAPSGTAGMLLDGRCAEVTGEWSLRGRRLARSTEFDLRVVPASVTRLLLELPEGLSLAASTGELAAPRPAESSGWSIWELHLGSRTQCRLRITPPVAAGSRQPLLLGSSRTNYVVRPEIVRFLAEFELEACETTLSEVRFALDQGLQVTAVEYGNDGDVVWRVIPGTDEETLVVPLPDPLSGPGAKFQIRGVAPIDPAQPWRMPRVRLPQGVELEALVTVKLQPPYEASDLQLDGYRQVELAANPGEGEMVVLRQLAPDARLLVVPSNQRLSASCRQVTLVSLQGEEWRLTSQLHLQATAGSAFEAAFDLPPGWEALDVQGDQGVGSAELTGWELASGTTGESTLRVGFLTALSPGRDQRLRVTARRAAQGAGERIPLPTLLGRALFDQESVVVLVAEEGFRPVLANPAQWRPRSWNELPAGDQNLDFLKGLSATARERAVVYHGSPPFSGGELVLQTLRNPGIRAPGAASLASRSQNAPVQSNAAGHYVAPLAYAATIEVQLSPSAGGYDRYRALLAMAGGADGDLEWELPEGALLLEVRYGGQVVEPRPEGGRLHLELQRADPDDKPTGRWLSIEYRIASRQALGSYRQPLAWPKFAFPVLTWEFEVTVPKHLRVSGLQGGLQLSCSQARHDALWGPLGRSPGAHRFQPWNLDDWRQLGQAVLGTSAGDAGGIEDRVASGSTLAEAGSEAEDSEGQTWRGTSLAPPEECLLTLWNRSQAQAVAWGLLCLSLMTTVMVRMRPSPRLRRLAIVPIAGLAGSVWLLSDLSAEFVGSALVGVVVGSLLATRWLAWPRRSWNLDEASIPSGSTQSFAHVSALCLAALLAGILAGILAAQAQDERTVESPRSEAMPAEEPAGEAVLVPVDKQGHPAGEAPVAYVSTRFLEWLNANARTPSLPDSLIASATWDGTLVGPRQLELTAHYDVHVLADREVVPVELPFVQLVAIGETPCHVDGRPQPVRLGRDGKSLIVELSRSPARQRIELSLRALVALESSDTYRAQWTMPALHDTTVAIGTSGSDPFQFTITTAGTAPQALSATEGSPRMSARPGPTPGLELRWGTSKQPAAPTDAELDASVAAMAEVFPGLVRTSYQTTCRVLSGSVDSLTWKLPPGSTVQSVQSAELSGFLVEPGDSNARQLVLEFSRPQQESFTATVTLLQPTPPGATEATLAPLELEGAGGKTAHLTVRRYALALRQPVDYRLSVSPANPEVVIKSLATDDLLANWPFSGARPQQALEWVRPGPLKLTLQNLPGGLAGTVTQRGRLTADRLEWVYVAEIERPQVPPFQYRLRIDERLRLQRISVQEDGAERVLRWSQQGDLLIVFLNDRAARAQTLRIEASLPIAAPAELEIPRCTLEGIPPGIERVTLHSGPELQVTPLSTEPGAEESVSRNDAGETRTWMKSPGAPLPRVQMGLLPPRLASDIAWILQTAGERPQVTIAVLFRTEVGRPRQYELHVPEAMAQEASIETLPTADCLQEPLGDGLSKLLFFPQGEERIFRVLLHLPMEPLIDGDWIPPEVVTPGVLTRARTLILPPDRTVALTAREIPDWLSESPWQNLVPTQATCHPLPVNGPVETLHFSDSRSPESSRTLADLRLEFASDGTLRGQYLLWLPARTPHLEFTWPQGCTPTALVMDGQPHPIPDVDADVWTVPLSDFQTPRLVWLTWTDPRPREPGWVDRLDESLPAPRNVPITVQLLSTQLSPDVVLGDRSTGPQEQSLEILLARWEAMLAAQERPAAPGSPAEGTLFSQAARRIERQFARLTEGRSEPLPVELEQRVDQLRRRTANLPLPSEGDALETASSALVLAAVPEAPHTVRWRDVAPDRSVAFQEPGVSHTDPIWVVRRSGLHLVLAGVTAFVLLLFIRKLSSLVGWLQERPGFACLAIGGLWWWMLQPSWLGVLLVLAAPWWWLRQVWTGGNPVESAG
ncbi:MAG: hypothetical protein ACKV0T_30905 [Planctomycetales bacterium]